ncbi:Hypothetical_protein [Hexamita inflata]|uniref:Hypothetical_protein n=1 Tax=Hexamita inflata TaxID=28002 RepID=A0ABP1HFG7_9EUKA
MIVNQLQTSEIVKIEQNSVNSDLIQFSPKHRGFSAKYLKQQQAMLIAAIFYNKMRYKCLKVQIVKRVRFSVWILQVHLMNRVKFISAFSYADPQRSYTFGRAEIYLHSLQIKL